MFFFFLFRPALDHLQTINYENERNEKRQKEALESHVVRSGSFHEKKWLLKYLQSTTIFVYYDNRLR